MKPERKSEIEFLQEFKKKSKLTEKEAQILGKKVNKSASNKVRKLKKINLN